MSDKKMRGWYTWVREGEDMITGDDDPREVKAVMLCGHIISTNSMKDYCLDQLNYGCTKIECPAYCCKISWPFWACLSVLKHSASEAELMEIDEKINRNCILKMKTVEQCPTCHGYLDKPDEIECDKVECPYCKKNKFFCWSCKSPWISPSDIICGNRNCDKGDKKLMILATCKKKEIFDRFTPSVRGCPNCGLLVEYTEQCTQMCCPDCKHYFCFYCLKGAKKKNELSCKPYDSQCAIADRQKTLPNL